jgi:hypothetical protein
MSTNKLQTGSNRFITKKERLNYQYDAIMAIVGTQNNLCHDDSIYMIIKLRREEKVII